MEKVEGVSVQHRIAHLPSTSAMLAKATSIGEQVQKDLHEAKRALDDAERGITELMQRNREAALRQVQADAFKGLTVSTRTEEQFRQWFREQADALPAAVLDKLPSAVQELTTAWKEYKQLQVFYELDSSKLAKETGEDPEAIEAICMQLLEMAPPGHKVNTYDLAESIKSELKNRRRK
jgi:Skp family chaperone for outer membrane proteins